MDDFEFARIMKKFVNEQTGLNLGYREVHQRLMIQTGYAKASQEFIGAISKMQNIPTVPNDLKPQT